MKPAQKDVIRAGMESYLAAEIRRQTRVLNDSRFRRHLIRNRPRYNGNIASRDLTTWDGYRDLIKCQIIVIRRACHALEAVRLVNKLHESVRDAEIAPSVRLREAIERRHYSPVLEDDTVVRWVNDGDPYDVLYGRLDRNAQKTVALEEGVWVGGFPW